MGGTAAEAYGYLKGLATDVIRPWVRGRPPFPQAAMPRQLNSIVLPSGVRHRGIQAVRVLRHQRGLAP
jgi:hypothetical protein